MKCKQLKAPWRPVGGEPSSHSRLFVHHRGEQLGSHLILIMLFYIVVVSIFHLGSLAVVQPQSNTQRSVKSHVWLRFGPVCLWIVSSVDSVKSRPVCLNQLCLFSCFHLRFHNWVVVSSSHSCHGPVEHFLSWLWKVTPVPVSPSLPVLFCTDFPPAVSDPDFLPLRDFPLHDLRKSPFFLFKLWLNFAFWLFWHRFFFFFPFRPSSSGDSVLLTSADVYPGLSALDQPC